MCWFALLESLSSRRSWGHGRQEGCARSGSSTVFVARKAKIKQWMVFGITRVTDVLSVFTFSYLKCLHSWPSISNFRKIFVAVLGIWLWLRVVSSNHLASSSDPRLVVLFESSPRRVTLVESSSSSQRHSWSNSRQVMAPHRVIFGESSCVIE